MTKLKDAIKDIVEIVALVPDQFKAQCFELLLKDVLAKSEEAAASESTLQVARAVVNPSPLGQQPEHAVQSPALEAKQPAVNSGSDISPADLHMKTRRFMEKHAVTVEELNNLFYKDGEQYQTLYTDLGVTGMSEGQIRIALLQCLHHSLIDGEFTTSVESVREECKMRKCYDLNNFTANLKKNAGLFDFGEWSKDVAELRLSEEGRKTLGSVVKTVS